MNQFARLRLVGAALLATMLGGCLGSLVGGGKPDTLYRFGDPGPAATVPLAVPRRVLAVLPVGLPAAAAGDRILTVESGTGAYVKDVRWISPATILFSDAVRGALTGRIPDLALVDRVTARQAQRYLTIWISRFEARYDAGSQIPVVAIEGQAVLADSATRAIVARMPIAERAPAGGAGAAMVAAAFDAAVRRASVGIADWTNANLTTGIPPEPFAVPTAKSAK